MKKFFKQLSSSVGLFCILMVLVACSRSYYQAPKPGISNLRSVSSQDALKWSAPKLVGVSTKDFAASILEHRVKSFDSGEKVVIWLERDPVSDFVTIWGNQGFLQGDWGVPKRLDTFKGDFAVEDQIDLAIDDQSNGLAVWRRLNGEGAIYSSFYHNGSWSSAARVSPVTPGERYAPKAVLGRHGQGRAAWSWCSHVRVSFATSCRVEVNALLPSGRWEEAHFLSQIKVSSQNPRIVSDGNGSGLVAWTEANDPNGSKLLYASRFSDVSGWSPRESVPQDTKDAVLDDLSMASTGKAIAIWASEHGIHGVTYTLENGWAEPSVVVASGSQLPFSPRTVINEKDEIYVAWPRWDQEDYSFYRPMIVHGRVGAPWDSPISLDEGSHTNAFWVVLTASATSGVTVAWRQEYKGVVAVHYEGTWSPPVTISQFDNVSVPSLAVDRTGRTEAVWTAVEPKAQNSDLRPKVWSASLN